MSPVNAAHRIAHRACFARHDDPIYSKVRALGADKFLGRQVFDAGDMDRPVSIPGYHIPYYRKAGYWYMVRAASTGDQLCAQMVTDERTQNVLDMLLDIEHPLWREDPGYGV